MKSKNYLHGFIILTIIIVFSACGPESTGTPITTPDPEETILPETCDPIIINADKGLTYIQLSDNSKIYLTDDTGIKFNPAGYCPGITEHSIYLMQGQIAIISQLPAGSRFNISNPDGYIAQINEVGYVSYNPDDGLFTLDCTSGNCAIGTDLLKLNQLACGESGKLDKDGIYEGPSIIDVESLVLVFGEWVTLGCGEIEVETPTPNAAATATAYCATFNSQFPSTPCPGVLP